jgi:hypothetical protein
MVIMFVLENKGISLSTDLHKLRETKFSKIMIIHSETYLSINKNISAFFEVYN